MPSIRVAVAGASGAETTFNSGLGTKIVLSLLKNGAAVTVLTRGSKANADKVAQLKAAGASLVDVDYADGHTLDTALKGVDVVVSTVSGAGFANQVALAQAAKRQGVKLFLPSEWGTRTIEETADSPLAKKRDLQLKLAEMELHYLLVFHTLFLEVVPFFCGPKEGKICLPGGGNVPVTATSSSDVAAYIGYILTHVPFEQLQNRHLVVEASRPTFRELAQEVQKRDASIELVDVPIQEYQKRFEESNSILDYLIVKAHKNVAGGDGSKAEVEAARSLYPDWRPRHYTDADCFKSA